MTRKDLNLSLNQSLLPPEKVQGSTHGATTGKQDRPGPKKRPTVATHARRENWHTMTIAGFAVLNMAFLLAAGIWLSTLQHTIGAPVTAMTTVTVPRIEIMLVEAHDRLDALRGQLDELVVAIDDHQQFTASVYAEKGDDRSMLPDNDDPAKTFSIKEIPNAADNWYVKLGTFSSEEAAARFSLQLGSTRQISRYDLPGSTSFELRLSGFEERESAEMVAGDIMEQTKLNGLTIWKGS